MRTLYTTQLKNIYYSSFINVHKIMLDTEIDWFDMKNLHLSEIVSDEDKV